MQLPTAIQVPQGLSKMLEAAPAVKKWMTDKLHITDLHHRAPAVRQLHTALDQSSVQQYLAGSFNNPDAYPDTVVSVCQRDMHLHKLVVAKGCEVLAKRWGKLWQGSKDIIALDDMLCCKECSIQPSYSIATIFFSFFYSWQITWPKQTPDVASALELLVMASVYDVPYLVCEAEVALRRGVTVENCCKLLEVADHHAAEQLRRFCLHFIANGHKLVSGTKGLQQLSPELLQEVESARQQLQHPE